MQAKWTEEEQHQLGIALKKFPADKYSPLGRYIKMSALFPNKTVRDVALRVKWMSKREEKKKKKGQDSSSKKRGGAQDKDGGKSQSAWPRSQNGGGLSEKANEVYRPITEVLDQNIVVIKQIQQNMMRNKVRENTDLLMRFRDNILKAQKAMVKEPSMAQMPPLPAQVNLDAAAFLGKRVEGK